MRVLLGEVSAWGGAGKKALELRRRALSRPPGELLEEGLWPKKRRKRLAPAAEQGDRHRLAGQFWRRIPGGSAA